VKVVVDPFTAAFNAAVDAFQAEDFDTALAKATEATTIAPDKASGFELGAKVASKKKDPDNVIALGEKAIALGSEDPQLVGLLAVAYRAKGDKVKAAEYEKKFAAANPDQPEILYNQAAGLYNKGDFKGAEPLLTKALEAKPDFADAHYLIGMCYVNLNKVADMKKHLHEYLKLEPKGKDASAAKEMLDAFK
jgi:protein O-GlcNAc transferase